MAIKTTLFVILLVTFLAIIGYTLFVYCGHDICLPNFGKNLQQAEIPDEIVVYQPLQSATVSSPLKISGRVRGYWMFEATMRGFLTDDKHTLIKQFPIMTKDNWMTADFVNFSAEVEFQKPKSNNGFLIIKNDNPSDLPEKEKLITIPIKF